MNAIVLVVFTLFSAPVSVNGTTATFTQVTSFDVGGKTEKNANTNCQRFVKAAQSAGMFGSCAAK